jgi:RNA polymerase sigma-70 factor (ECF subfamily)
MPSGSQIGDLDDDALAADVVLGHTDAMTTLFDRYRNEVFGVAWRVLRRGDEARDMVQQVYMEAYREIRNFDPSRGSFKSWLLAKAFSRSINRLKQFKTDPLGEATEIDEDIPSGSSNGGLTRFHLLPPELSHLTTELLAKLDPREREVITLIFFRGYTRKQAAAELKETLSAVRHSLKKALTILLSALTEAEHAVSARAKGTQQGKDNSHGQT